MWWRGRRSKETLRNRLELVLSYDRAEIPPGKIDALRKELMSVVSRYFPGAESGEVQVEQQGGSVALVASIPLDGARVKGADLH